MVSTGASEEVADVMLSGELIELFGSFAVVPIVRCSEVSAGADEESLMLCCLER